MLKFVFLSNEYETDSEDDSFDKEDEDMLDISKLKILENKRFVCLVRYKILKAVYIMMTRETKGHRDAAVFFLMAENSNKTHNREQKRAGI